MPQGSSEANLHSAVYGSMRVLDSLLIEVLCFDDSASSKQMSRRRCSQQLSTRMLSLQRAHAKTQNSKRPAIIRLCSSSSPKQIASKRFTATTGSGGACLSFRFLRYIACAAPLTLWLIARFMSIPVNPMVAFAKQLANTHGPKAQTVFSQDLTALRSHKLHSVSVGKYSWFSLYKIYTCWVCTWGITLTPRLGG